MLAPPSSCRTPECGRLAFQGGYCEKCAKPAVDPNKPIDKHEHHREWKKLYLTTRWRKLRDLILRRDPVCMECKRRASTIADHKIDHRGDLILFWDPNNIRGICKPCHDIKTGSTHGVGERAKPKPGLVNGKVVDYAPNVSTPKSATSRFDFLAALLRKPLPENDGGK